MSIYTKSGDRGETGLLGGLRISKTDRRIAAIGCVDELNAALGVLRTQKTAEPIDTLLERIQHELFCLGAELADPQKKYTAALIHESNIKSLEREIDRIELKLPKLKHFILPTGTAFSAQAHFSRAVCRRTERTLIKLHRKEPLNAEIPIYINRLSDLFFMLAREDMFDKKKRETPWKTQ